METRLRKLALHGLTMFESNIKSRDSLNGWISMIWPELIDWLGKVLHSMQYEVWNLTQSVSQSTGGVFLWSWCSFMSYGLEISMLTPDYLLMWWEICNEHKKTNPLYSISVTKFAPELLLYVMYVGFGKLSCEKDVSSCTFKIISIYWGIALFQMMHVCICGITLVLSPILDVVFLFRHGISSPNNSSSCSVHVAPIPVWW